MSEPRKTTSQFTFPISSKVNTPDMFIVSFRVRVSLIHGRILLFNSEKWKIISIYYYFH